MKNELYPSIVEGWNLEREDLRDAHDSDSLRKLVTEFSNLCNLNCPGCFTVKVNSEGIDEGELKAALNKTRLSGEMSPGIRLSLLKEAVELGAKSVDIVGAGEPMLDLNLREFVEEAERLGVHVNIFTHGDHKELRDIESAKWWRDKPVSFFIKLWSRDSDVNNKLVRPKGRKDYTSGRDEALRNLFELGFNEPRIVDFDGRRQRLTRIGADILVTRSNIDEIPDLFRFCRDNNMMPEIKNFIPQGPTLIDHLQGTFSKLSSEDQQAITSEVVTNREIAELRRRINDIDREEYGNDPMDNFYIGGTFCTQSKGALYVRVNGMVYSCVGTGYEYGNYVPNVGFLQAVLRERIEQVGFGCFPRLEKDDNVSPDEEIILSQE